MSLWSTFKSTFKPWQTTRASSSDTKYLLPPPSLSKHLPYAKHATHMPFLAFLNKFKTGNRGFATLIFIVGFFIGSATGRDVASMVNQSFTYADVCKRLQRLNYAQKC